MAWTGRKWAEFSVAASAIAGLALSSLVPSEDQAGSREALAVGVFIAVCTLITLGVVWRVASYPHRGWRRLAIVAAPVVALAAFSGLRMFWFNQVVEDAIIAVILLVATPGAMLFGRDAIVWVKRGFEGDGAA